MGKRPVVIWEPGKLLLYVWAVLAFALSATAAAWAIRAHLGAPVIVFISISAVLIVLGAVTVGQTCDGWGQAARAALLGGVGITSGGYGLPNLLLDATNPVCSTHACDFQVSIRWLLFLAAATLLLFGATGAGRLLKGR